MQLCPILRAQRRSCMHDNHTKETNRSRHLRADTQEITFAQEPPHCPEVHWWRQDGLHPLPAHPNFEESMSLIAADYMLCASIHQTKIASRHDLSEVT